MASDYRIKQIQSHKPNESPNTWSEHNYFTKTIEINWINPSTKSNSQNWKLKRKWDTEMKKIADYYQEQKQTEAVKEIETKNILFIKRKGPKSEFSKTQKNEKNYGPRSRFLIYIYIFFFSLFSKSERPFLPCFPAKSLSFFFLFLFPIERRERPAKFTVWFILEGVRWRHFRWSSVWFLHSVKYSWTVWMTFLLSPSYKIFIINSNYNEMGFFLFLFSFQ